MQVVYGPQGGVLWLDAEGMSLGGYCRYWIEGNQFGGFACPEHPEVGAVSYRQTGAGWVRERRMPTLDGPVYEGEWLSDDDWRAVRYG